MLIGIVMFFAPRVQVPKDLDKRDQWFYRDIFSIPDSKKISFTLWGGEGRKHEITSSATAAKKLLNEAVEQWRGKHKTSDISLLTVFGEKLLQESNSEIDIGNVDLILFSCI